MKTTWPAPFEDVLLRQRLGIEATLRRAPRGALVGEVGPRAAVIVAVDGTLALRSEGRHVRTLDAPVTSGLDAWLAEVPWVLERRASEATRYASVCRDALDWASASDPSLAARLGKHVARQSCASQRREVERASGYDDLFATGPGAKLAPGPYRFGPFDAAIFVMEDEQRRVCDVLPTGLRLAPGLGGRYLVMASFVEHACRIAVPDAIFGYREVAIFVPVVTALGRPGLFAVELYPDAAMPVLLGREIYGFPKRLGRIHRQGAGFELVVGQRPAFRASVDGERTVAADDFGRHLLGALFGTFPTSVAHGLGALFGWADRVAQRPGRAWPNVPLLLEKHIASEAASRAPDVHKLVEVPLAPFGLGDFAICDGARVWLDDDVLPLGGEVCAAARCRMGFVLSDGNVHRDLRTTRSNGLMQRWAGWGR